MLSRLSASMAAVRVERVCADVRDCRAARARASACSGGGPPRARARPRRARGPQAARGGHPGGRRARGRPAARPAGSEACSGARTGRRRAARGPRGALANCGARFRRLTPRVPRETHLRQLLRCIHRRLACPDPSMRLEGGGEVRRSRARNPSVCHSQPRPSGPATHLAFRRAASWDLQAEAQRACLFGRARGVSAAQRQIVALARSRGESP